MAVVCALLLYGGAPPQGMPEGACRGVSLRFSGEGFWRWGEGTLTLSESQAQGIHLSLPQGEGWSFAFETESRREVEELLEDGRPGALYPFGGCWRGDPASARQWVYRVGEVYPETTWVQFRESGECSGDPGSLAQHIHTGGLTLEALFPGEPHPFIFVSQDYTCLAPDILGLSFHFSERLSRP